MKPDTLTMAGSAVEVLSNIGDVSIYDVIDALIGVCFSEEEAGELDSYLSREID